jgi:putative methyltransferase (TIGR04325 family)
VTSPRSWPPANSPPSRAPPPRLYRRVRRCRRLRPALISGTVQYVEQDFDALLPPLPNKQRHLLINRVPLSDRPTYFTVQDIGTARCPYRVANRADFIASLQAFGYALVNSWSCPGLACRVLFRPGRTVSSYAGMYLRLANP